MAGQKWGVVTTDMEKWARGIRESQGAFRKRMPRIGEEVGEIAVLYLEQTTATWDHPVLFEFKVRSSGYNLVVEAGTDDPIWNILDKGTRKDYPIVPKGPWPLRFRANYTPKTRVGVLGSTHGGSYGPEVRAWGVIHPGIEARRFTETMIRVIEPDVVEEVERDIAQWAAQYF